MAIIPECHMSLNIQIIMVNVIEGCILLTFDINILLKANAHFTYFQNKSLSVTFVGGSSSFLSLAGLHQTR